MNKEKKVASATLKKTGGAYGKLESWAAKNDQKIFIVLLFLSILLSLLSFNARISEAHDDALYLEGGWRFVKEYPDYFYTQNAPLYPMLLAVFILIFGFKLVLFKLLSVVFSIVGFALFYKALRGRVPAVVFLPVAVFQAINYLILYYASMTFTEAFYFFLQGLFFWFAARTIEKVDSQGVQLNSQWRLWLAFGLSMFLISTCKSSAIVVVPAALLFFALDRNWKAAGASLGSYLIFKIVYEVVVRLTWTAQNQFSGQAKILMQKDPYNKSLGNEDLSGFIQRFLENCDLGLSKRFYQLLGWRSELSGEVYGSLTLTTAALILIGFWRVVKDKNKLLVLLALFSGAQLILSYIILQVRWDQARITLVCMPVLLLLILYAFYAFTRKPGGAGQPMYAVICLLMISSLFMSSFKRAISNLPIVKRNLAGDKYYGYTPDWRNFLKASEWCADSLGADALVASRKAPMSFVYGKGKKFFPVYSVVKKDTVTQRSDPDSALAYFQQNEVTHVILPSLRVNPIDPTGGIINTLHFILGPINEKYPEKLRLIHVEGGEEEPSYVYEIKY